MRDTPGQSAHGLHLLGMAVLSFQAADLRLSVPLLRNIHDQTIESKQFAAGISSGSRATGNPAVRSARQVDVKVACHVACITHLLTFNRLNDDVTGIGGNGVEKLLETDFAGRLKSQQFPGTLVPQKFAGLEVITPYADVAGVQRKLQRSLALSQKQVNALSFRDVLIK